MDDGVAVALLRAHAVSEGTSANRRTGWNKWCVFCARRGEQPIRSGGMTAANADLAERFVANCAVEHRMVGTTIKKYLIHVGAHHKALRLPSPVDASRMSGDWHLRQAVQAAENMHPGGRRARAGFSNDQIAALCTSTQFRDHARLGCMFRAVALNSFNGFSRAQMWCVKSPKHFSKFQHVTRGDVAFTGVGQARRMSIWIPSGKTNKVGRYQYYGVSSSPWCAMAATDEYMQRTQREARSEDPLFADERGRPLTYQRWYKVLRAAIIELGLDPAQYGTHSFRRGGATSLYNMTRDLRAVEAVGGWSHKSGTVWSYIEEDARQLAMQTGRIANAQPVQVPAWVHKGQRDARLAGRSG